MAKKSKKQDAESKKAAEKAAAETAAAAKKAKKAAVKADEQRRAAKATLKDAAKKATAALAARDKAEKKAKAVGVTLTTSTDKAGLLQLALRDTEAKLVAAEHRLAQVQQQLDGERALATVEAEALLEDAIVEAAVEETVAEAILGAEIVALTGGEDVTDAEIAEIVADTLEEVAADAAVGPTEPTGSAHEGEAEEAAAVFEAADVVPTVAPSELTPPLPNTPADDAPNATWTVIRLRAAARERGLTGTSGLSKAALLERLSGD